MKLPQHHCGRCTNCRDLNRVRIRVLACCNPPFSHADDNVISVWNTEVARLPCLTCNAELDIARHFNALRTDVLLCENAPTASPPTSDMLGTLVVNRDVCTSKLAELATELADLCRRVDAVLKK